MEEAYLQLGALGIILIFTIKELFAYLKTRNVNGVQDQRNGILNELKMINENHLHSIEKAVNEGDDRIVDAINSGNQKIIELLGEIKGKLSK